MNLIFSHRDSSWMRGPLLHLLSWFMVHNGYLYGDSYDVPDKELTKNKVNEIIDKIIYQVSSCEKSTKVYHEGNWGELKLHEQALLPGVVFYCRDVKDFREHLMAFIDKKSE